MDRIICCAASCVGMTHMSIFNSLLRYRSLHCLYAEERRLRGCCGCCQALLHPPALALALAGLIPLLLSVKPEQQLLDAGARGATALHCAVSTRSLEATRQLLRYCPEEQVRGSWIGRGIRHDRCGCTGGVRSLMCWQREKGIDREVRGQALSGQRQQKP